MKGRNPNKGRSFVGSSIARSGTQPKARTGRPDKTSPGARTSVGNRPITSASLMQTGSKSSSANDYTKQGEQFVKQSPEPFRNSNPSARPSVPPTKDSGSEQSAKNGGFYSGLKGNRISESLLRSKPQRNIAAVGIGSGKMAGAGRSQGKVVGQGQVTARRAGAFVNQPSAKRPSFYGR